MSYFNDVSYARQISHRLEGFKVKRDSPFLTTFRCPICGDSKKNKRKKRAYFYTKEGNLNMRCHNCNASMRFSSFLHWFDPNLYKVYALDSFKGTAKEEKIEIQKVSIAKYFDVTANLLSIEDLSSTHPVRKYVEKRKIPKAHWSKLFYAPKFFKWASEHTDKFTVTEKTKDHPRLIIGWYDIKNNLFAYSARSFFDEKPKYYFIVLDETAPKFFGLDTLDDSKESYVVEGPIDAMMLNNAVAVGNANLSAYYNPKSIYIPDVDVYNKEVMRQVKTMVDSNLKVCFMPEMNCGKDINEMVKYGLTEFEIKKIIKENTYQGLAAQLKLTQWRKI